VQRIAAGDGGGGEQPLDVEVALSCRRRADADHPVDHPCGQAVPIGVGDGKDGLETLLPAGSGDAHGDLPAVRDQDPAQHGGSALRIDDDQRLAELHGGAVLGQNRVHAPVARGRDVVH